MLVRASSGSAGGSFDYKYMFIQNRFAVNYKQRAYAIDVEKNTTTFITDTSVQYEDDYIKITVSGTATIKAQKALSVDFYPYDSSTPTSATYTAGQTIYSGYLQYWGDLFVK